MSDTEDLRTLMEADRWIDRVNAQSTHLPELVELSAVENTLRDLVKALQTAQAAQAPVRSAYQEAQREAARLAQRARDLATTLATSTANARELAALQNELQHVRELLGRVEDRELDLLIEVEPLDEAVAGVRARAQPCAERRGVLLAEIGALRATLDEELTSLREARRARAAALRPSLLARYDGALGRVGTSGAAQVLNGRCDGCRIALSPLDVDRWKVQPPDTFMDCPECGRLLLP